MSRRHVRPIGKRKPAARPALEGLEDRLLLYSDLGAQWTKPVLVTYSIVPDGTSIGGTPSNLAATLNAKFSTSAWQQAIQKAAAVWEAVAHINLAEVPDDGSPIGTSGDQQGDPRFGDIRIGGFAQQSSQLAFAFVPPPFNGGTNAGDIFFNTAQSWQINGTTYDLETVAIHELGHALGLGHSSISSADQYASYTNSKQSPSSDDSTGLQSIYGAPGNDPYETAGGGANNNSSTYATPIGPYVNAQAQAVLPNAAISSASDVDWYVGTAPSNAGSTLVVRAQATGLSSFSPAVSVYTSGSNGLTLVASGSAPDSFGGTATATVSGVTPGKTYWIKVLGASSGYLGEGSYGLLVNFGNTAQPSIAPPSTVTPSQPDQNPSSYPEGTGWQSNGVFTPFGGGLSLTSGTGSLLGSVVGLVGNVVDGLLNTLHLITIGTLSGYGDTLDARTTAEAHVRPRHSGGHVPVTSGAVHPHHHLAPSSSSAAHDAVLAAWGRPHGKP